MSKSKTSCHSVMILISSRPFLEENLFSAWQGKRSGGDPLGSANGLYFDIGHYEIVKSPR